MLTNLGLTPQYAWEAEWRYYDIADLGLGQWVLMEQKTEDSVTTHRSTGVYRFGKWSKPLAPAVWNDTGTGGVSRDARYIWRAPNIAPNPQQPPTPPQDNTPWPNTSWANSGMEAIYYTGPMHLELSYGPDGGPGEIGYMGQWTILDGSPNRWANVGVMIRMRLQGDHAVPVHAGISVNGKLYECASWQPWETYSLYADSIQAAAWLNSGGGFWIPNAYPMPYGSTTYQGASFEISLGSRYAVALGVHSESISDSESRTITNVCVVDRSRGTALSARWAGVAFAGPLVKGNKAIFYGVPFGSSAYNHPIVRVIMDLVTMTFQTEPCPETQYADGGTYAPSYMSDVPRLINLASSGSGDGPRRLVMDNDEIEVAGESIAYSGNNIVLRPYSAPARFQNEFDYYGGFAEVVVWSPDSDLAGGDDRPKGYFL